MHKFDADSILSSSASISERRCLLKCRDDPLPWKRPRYSAIPSAVIRIAGAHSDGLIHQPSASTGQSLGWRCQSQDSAYCTNRMSKRARHRLSVTKYNFGDMVCGVWGSNRLIWRLKLVNRVKISAKRYTRLRWPGETKRKLLNFKQIKRSARLNFIQPLNWTFWILSLNVNSIN